MTLSGTTANRLYLQENEIVKIAMDIRRFQKNQLTEDDSPELQKVMQENAKLKHRLAILNAVSESSRQSLLEHLLNSHSNSSQSTLKRMSSWPNGEDRRWSR